MLLPDRITSLTVNAFTEESGVLSQPSQCMFQYTRQQPISITMPVRDKPYQYGQVHPCFTQHLPEGYVRKYISERLARYAHVNDMYLLALQQNKGIGHLSYHSALNEVVDSAQTPPICLQEILSYKGKKGLFEQLLDRYYLNGLASGVQPKVLVNAIDTTSLTGEPVLSMERSTITQSDFIIKTFDSAFPLLTVNEFVCMEAARACDLEPSSAWLSDDLNTFVTQRFDKIQGQRLALEDFTVLLGKTGDQKYQSSYETVLRVTQMFTRCEKEVRRMFRYIVFNCLIGNGDAHLKNFSIQYDAKRDNIRLSPPYDITHTVIYDTVDNDMALKLDGSKRFPDKGQLIKLGKVFNITEVEMLIDEMAQQLVDYVHRSDHVHLFSGLKASILRSIDLAVGEHYRTKAYIHDKHKKHP